MRKEIEVSYDDDQITHNLTVPAKNQLCDVCEGDGKVDNPAFSNGITQSEREEMGEEAFQSYMDGDYDVPCDCCEGRGIIQVPDVSRCDFSQKRFLVKARQFERAKAEAERDAARMHRAECWYMYQ